MSEAKVWRTCGSCKKNIVVGQKYYICPQSRCKKSIYCSMPCFDDHSSIMRHKESWAEEKIAKEIVDEPEKNKSRLDSARLISKPNSDNDTKKDVLVVASKLKEYIRSKSGFNTSASVLNRLSDMIRVQCDHAIERAKSDNRKTVMDKDFYL